MGQDDILASVGICESCTTTSTTIKKDLSVSRGALLRRQSGWAELGSWLKYRIPRGCSPDIQDLLDICAIMQANGTAARALEFTPIGYTTSESAIARPAGDGGLSSLENSGEMMRTSTLIVLGWASLAVTLWSLAS